MPNEENVQTNYVTIKAPAFIETAAESWFAILEAQFHLRGITSEETRFWHTLAALPPELITKLPTEETTSKIFTSLKAAVLSIHEDTKPELFEKLISTTKLTGKPSLFLNELMQTARMIGVGEDLVRHKFLQALNPSISTALAAQKDLTLVQLGKLAD